VSWTIDFDAVTERLPGQDVAMLDREVFEKRNACCRSSQSRRLHGGEFPKADYRRGVPAAAAGYRLQSSTASASGTRAIVVRFVNVSGRPVAEGGALHGLWWRYCFLSEQQ